MVKFILNEKEISSGLSKGMPLLDFIRYQQHLTGTKIGCREGDCGACTILTGEIENGQLVYRSATSCLMALGNAHGKHIVTVEGVNLNGLNFIQQAFTNEGASQCGYCTPGFMVSLAGYALNHHNPSPEGAIDAVNGNICRCTGYKSIERASATLALLLQKRKSETLVQFAVDQKILPAYFLTIQDRLTQLLPTKIKLEKKEGQIIRALGGGTDLYVQKHDDMLDADIDFLLDKTHLHGIEQIGENCVMGAAVTVTDMLESPVFNQYFPRLKAHIKLVSSTPIRNMATIAGNFINGSPIGDFTIFFLALDAQIVLTNGQHSRTLPLRELYKGYKTLNKTADEIVEQVIFRLPDEHTQFNFEKVSKRIHLDIASVNTAIQIKVENGVILSAGISAGGVGPIPLYLQNSSAFLLNKILSPTLVDELMELVQQEIQPMSDARGTSTYKRLLLAQLIKAHFFQLYPEAFL